MQNDLDFDADNDIRTVLVVHDTMPPFLDGRVRFTKQVCRSSAAQPHHAHEGCRVCVHHL